MLRTVSIEFLGCIIFQVARLFGLCSGHPLRGGVGKEQLRLRKKTRDGPILASQSLMFTFMDRERVSKLEPAYFGRFRALLIHTS